MFGKRLISCIVLLFLLSSSACSMPSGIAIDTGPSQDPTAAIETRVAEVVASTNAAATALANDVASTLTALATPPPEATFTPSMTLTTAFTLTPSITPSLTNTLTPEFPTVSVSLQTNCRSGPGTAYDVLGVMNVGQSARVVGRSLYGDTWIILLPSNPAITCWLWGQYATVVGNTAGLPAFDPPPTPTPTTAFNVVFNSIENCGGGIYGIKFKITNTGTIVWESNRPITTDLVTAETNTVSRNEFPNYNDAGCALASSDGALGAGDVGYSSSGTFTANPAGHAFSASIRVCTLNGLAGVCLDKTINFTP